jgi:hypothetical protein
MPVKEVTRIDGREGREVSGGEELLSCLPYAMTLRTTFPRTPVSRVFMPA